MTTVADRPDKIKRCQSPDYQDLLLLPGGFPAALTVEKLRGRLDDDDSVTDCDVATGQPAAGPDGGDEFVHRSDSSRPTVDGPLFNGPGVAWEADERDGRRL